MLSQSAARWLQRRGIHYGWLVAGITFLTMLTMSAALGMTALGAVVANRWFVARRGLVVGPLTASAATGQLAFLPFAAWMIEHWGWRSAIAPIFVACAVMGVLALAFVRNRPSDVGLAAYGDTAPAVAAVPPAMVMNFATPFNALAEASRSGTFWILFATFFICGLSTNGLVQTHFISAVAAWGAGLTRTLLLTYTPALYAAGAACWLAAGLVLLIQRPARAPTAAAQPA